MSKEVVDVGFTGLALKLPKMDVKCPICGKKTRFYLDVLRFCFDGCGHVVELRVEDLAEALKVLKERGLVKEGEVRA